MQKHAVIRDYSMQNLEITDANGEKLPNKHLFSEVAIPSPRQVGDMVMSTLISSNNPLGKSLVKRTGNFNLSAICLICYIAKILILHTTSKYAATAPEK